MNDKGVGIEVDEAAIAIKSFAGPFADRSEYVHSFYAFALGFQSSIMSVLSKGLTERQELSLTTILS